MTTPFLLLMPTGRVGSNAVVDILGQSRQVRVENEKLTGIFGRHMTTAAAKADPAAIARCWDEQRVWVEHFYASPPPGAQAAGFKVAIELVADPVAFAALLRARPGRLVFLFRRDIVKQALSIVRAEINAERLKEKYGKGRFGVDRSEDVLPPTPIEPRRLLAACERCERNLAFARAFVAWLGWPVLTVEYAEMFARLDAFADELGRFLGVGGLKPKTRWIKGTSDDLRSVIVNYDEVEAALRSAGYAATA